MRIRSIPGLALLPILAVLLAGCPFSPEPTDDPPELVFEYLPPISPQNVLENLKTAYKEENYERYVELFAPNFIFEFSPTDIIENPDLPASWPLADELSSTQNMFRDETVERIFIRFTPTIAVPATEGDNAPPGSFKMYLDTVHLEVDQRLENDDLLTLLVDNDRALFFFIETDEMTSDNQRIWKINLWRDQPIGNLALASPSALASR